MIINIPVNETFNEFCTDIILCLDLFEPKVVTRSNVAPLQADLVICKKQGFVCNEFAYIKRPRIGIN